MGNKVPKLKLTYFNIQGVAEKVRLALVLQDIPFEDERINMNDWNELKTKTKFGQLPLLEIDGKNTVAQSEAMLRFVARLKSKTLYPQEPPASLLVDECMGLIGDFTRAWMPCLYLSMRPATFGYPDDFGKTDEGKAKVEEMRTNFLKETMPKFMGYFETFLGDGPFLCGKNVTIADLSLLPTLYNFTTGNVDYVPKDCLEAYPKIAAWVTRMRELPKIKAWYTPKPVEPAKVQPRILMVLTSNDKLGETGEQTGWYLPEVAHPHWIFVKAGYKLTYASIQGGVAPIDEGSIEASKDEESQNFFNDEECMKLTRETIPIAEAKAEDYDCIFYAGGFGTMWDFPDSVESATLAGQIYDNGGVVAAVCHGPCALVNVKTKDGELLVKGKKVTAFTNAEEDAVKRREVVPWTCEDKLAEIGAEFVDGGAWQPSVQISDRLMTGQNPQSASPLAEKIRTFFMSSS